MNRTLDKYYVDAIYKNEILGEDEVKELISLYQRSKDENVLSKLIFGNLKMIVDVSYKYCFGEVDINDLVAEGIAALIKAVNNYDFSQTKFSTLAYTCLDRALKRYRNGYEMITVPEKQYKAVYKVKEVIDSFVEENGYKPSIKEIKERLDNPKDYEVYEAKAATMLSTDETIGDSENSYVDMISDDEVDIEEMLDNETLIDKVSELLASNIFSDVEKNCFESFAYGDSISSIARRNNITESNVRKVIGSVKNRLKNETQFMFAY